MMHNVCASVSQLETASDAASNAAAEAAAWNAAGRFGVAIRDFYRGLAPQIETLVQNDHDLSDSTSRTNRLQSIRAAARLVRLIDARDAKLLSGANPCGLLVEAGWFDLLSWQSSRLESALVDAPPSDVEFLSAAARAYRAQAAEIAEQPRSGGPDAASIAIDAPAAISLAAKPEETIDVKVRNTSDQEAKIWLMIDFLTQPRSSWNCPSSRRSPCSRNGCRTTPGTATNRQGSHAAAVVSSIR